MIFFLVYVYNIIVYEIFFFKNTALFSLDMVIQTYPICKLLFREHEDMEYPKWVSLFN